MALLFYEWNHALSLNRRIMLRGCLFVLAFSLGIPGCGLPWDPENTLENVRGQVLRVGISHNPPWTNIRTEGEPTGDEVELVKSLAESLDAKIEWQRSGEMDLMKKLEHFEIDLLIGGLTKDTPWKKRVGLSRPHTKTEQHDYVIAVPPGENAWLLFIDRHIAQMQQPPE